MKRNITVRTLCAMLFALCSSAQAQQPKKIPRIGLSTLPPLPLSRPASRHSGRVCASLGTWRGKILSLSIDLQRKNRSRARARGRTSASQGRCYRHGWCASDPCRQGSNCYDSHCHGAGCRSRWKRVRRQPCATRREHYWIVKPCPGDKRKTTGASEGDRSQALPRGRLRDFDLSRATHKIKRDGTRRRGIRSEASIPRRTRIPRILRLHSEGQARDALRQSSCWRALCSLLSEHGL